MNKYTKPKIDESKLIANPLAGADFKILINRITDGNSFVQDKDGIMLPRQMDLEKEEYTKLYTKSENRLIVSKLSSNAQRLYIWIAYELECGKDFIWINKKRFMEENDIKSVNTFKSGLEELCRYLLIYPTLEVKNGYYWINPRLFFCGSRPNKYPNNVELYSER